MGERDSFREKKEISIDNCLMNTISFNPDDINHTSSTPKEKKGKAEKDEFNEKMLLCTECKYKCKKETSLKKHIITKHEVHQCKECDEKLPTFMNLLKHVAKNHYKDQGEGEKRHSEDDAILDELEAAFKIKKQEN